MRTMPEDADGRPASARRRILAAARDLLREQGFAQFRIERVAAHAGLTRRTVYNQFDDREALYRASRLELLESFEFHLPDEVSPGGDPQQSLGGFFGAVLEIFRGSEHVELQASLLRDSAALPWLPLLYRLRVERPIRLALESHLLAAEGDCALPPSAARQLAQDGVEMLKSATWLAPQPIFSCRELAIVYVERIRSRQAAQLPVSATPRLAVVLPPTIGRSV